MPDRVIGEVRAEDGDAGWSLVYVGVVGARSGGMGLVDRRGRETKVFHGERADERKEVSGWVCGWGGGVLFADCVSTYQEFIYITGYK